MSAFTQSEPYQVIWLIRRLFRAFADRSASYLDEFGISVADRAVLEFLYPDRALSVPEIAARYRVSRQHVQVTANTLLEAGLVTTGENPRHKRSPLLMLTTEGRRIFRAILKKDEVVVNQLFSGLTRKNVQITRETLQALFDSLEKEELHA